MDMELVVQAFAAQMYTAVLDIVQQVDPLTGLPEHAERSKKVLRDVAGWLTDLTPEDLNGMVEHNEHLPFDRWLDADGYDPTAVCSAAQARIFDGLDMAQQNGIDGYQLIHQTGLYLLDMDNHKIGWLAERAANLLALGL
jgi:hypothetical protein